MTLTGRAQTLKIEVGRLLTSPAAAILPPLVRGLLNMQAELMVALAERVETLERKSDG
jgi:hypothetical protein